MNTIKQQGISMIEVLVTIVVMSFGFLPLIAFQVGALKHLQGSNQHYVVTNLASSIAESVMANAKDAGSYNGAKISTIDESRDCSDNACTIAEQDLIRWKSQLGEYNMQGLEGEIEVDGKIVTVDMSWYVKSFSQEGGAGRSLEKQTYRMQVSL